MFLSVTQNTEDIKKVITPAAANNYSEKNGETVGRNVDIKCSCPWMKSFHIIPMSSFSYNRMVKQFTGTGISVKIRSAL